MQVDAKVGDKTIKVANPEYAQWIAQDQHVLSYFLTTLMCDVLKQVATAKAAAQLWSSIEEIFSSQTWTRAVNTHIALANMKKGGMTINEYLSKMKSLADDMSTVGKPLGDEELVSYIY